MRSGVHFDLVHRDALQFSHAAMRGGRRAFRVPAAGRLPRETQRRHVQRRWTHSGSCREASAGRAGSCKPHAWPPSATHFQFNCSGGRAHPQSPLGSFSKYGATVSQLAHAPFDRSRPISLPVQHMHTSDPTITSLCKQLLVETKQRLRSRKEERDQDHLPSARRLQERGRSSLRWWPSRSGLYQSSDFCQETRRFSAPKLGQNP